MSIDEDLNYIHKNYTQSDKGLKYRKYIRLYRVLSYDDVQRQSLSHMPGFRITWYYSGAEVKPDDIYNKIDVTKAFVRY